MSPSFHSENAYTHSMPANAEDRHRTAEAKARGIIRVRTVRLPHGEYAHVYVVRKRGPRGGHTVMTAPEKEKN